MVIDLQGIIESDWTSRIGDKCTIVVCNNPPQILWKMELT